MFKPHNLALMIAVLLGGASAAYAATTSSPTTKVVGFKPIYRNTDGTGAVSGKLMLGEQLTVDPEKLDYFDHDDYVAKPRLLYVDMLSHENSNMLTRNFCKKQKE